MSSGRGKATIAKVDVTALRLPLHERLVAAWGTADHAGNILVRISSDAGVVGFGDTQSFPIIGTGSQAALVATLRDDLAPAIMDEDAFNLNRLHQKMDAAIGGFPFAKHAIDMAVHDLVAKTLDVPLNVLFGGLLRDELPTERAVDLHDREKTNRLVREAAEAGYRYVEVKLGGDLEVDIRTVAEAREALGPRIQLKIDGNGIYTYPAAKRLLRQLEPYHVDIIEQPLAAWDLVGLARLRDETSGAIVLDESLLSHEHLLTAIRLGACDGAHLKLPRVGGLRNAWRTMAILDAAGLIYLPGAMMASGVGTAALNHLFGGAKHLYAGVPGSPLKYYTDDITIDPPAVGPIIKIPTGPGLGVELNEDVIARHLVDM